MKRLLSLLLAVILILPLNTGIASAKYAGNTVLFSEDFNDYKGESTLPDGWSWTAAAAAGVVNDTSPAEFGYGNDTALKIKSENHSASYTLKKSIGSVDITSGVVKLSFQVNFEHVSSSSISYTQTLSVYAGNANGPYIKGISIVNGKVRYYSGNTYAKRWNASYTTAYVEEGRWYNFDIISDYDNDRTVYYMNGNPLYDEATGKRVETAAIFGGSSSPVTAATQILIGARTKHASATDGGDIMIDNITVSRGTASGAYCKGGNELTENPEKLDIKFNNTVRLSDFAESEVSVNTYAADDILMLRGKPVDFRLENLSQSGCELVFDTAAELNDYDKIKIDFGSSTDMLGGRLSYIALVKIPGQDGGSAEELIYDGDNPGESPAEILVSKADVTQYAYESDGKSKSADFYTATTEGGIAEVTFAMKDGSNIFVPGNEYRVSFKIKPLETNYWNGGSTRDFNFRGIFDEKRNDDGSICFNEGAVRWFYMSTRYRTIGYHAGNSDKVKAFGFDYKYNGNMDINSDADAMFNANQWVDVTIDYYPDTKISCITAESENSSGQKLSGGEKNYPVFLSNKTLSKTYAAAYPNIDTELIDGALKTVGFTTQANGSRFMLDDVKISKKEIADSRATLKYAVLKDENGGTVQVNGTAFDAGANRIEIYFDGTVDETVADKITVSGSNVPAYYAVYDSLSKVLTIDFSDAFLTGGSYSISLPPEMSFAGDVSGIDFEVADGGIIFKEPEIKIESGSAFAKAAVKNTSSYSDNSAYLIAASYKDGMTVDAKCADVYSGSGSLADIKTDLISAENADTVKAFLLSKNGLIHLAQYSEEVIAQPSEKEREFEHKYSGSTDGGYVTAVLMNPAADDKYRSYELSEICSDGAFSYIDVIKTADGGYSLGFDIDGASGRYTLYVMSEYGDEIYKKEILYSSADDRRAAQQLVINAVSENETSDVLQKVITDNAIELGLADIDLYENADREYVAKMLYDSVKQTAVDTENTYDVCERVADICIIEALKSGNITDIDKYSGIAGVFGREPIKTWYAKNLADTANVTKRLIGKEISDENDLAEKFMEALALGIIEKGNGYSYVKELCELLANKIGIDTKGASISTYRSMDGKNYTDYAKLKEDFERLTKNSDSAGTSGSGGSSNSNRSHSGGTSSVLPTGSTAAEPLTEYVFDDISEYGWAAESITNLYKKNIISGRSERIFAPSANVLREEFVKMTVAAFNITGTADIEFSDVADDDWFKPYICSAYGAGIVNGEGDTFGTGKSITRQDMAKIIYEIAAKKGIKLEAADISAFNDNGEIAPYALNAVAALYKNGIVNGKDGGRFAPNDYATRAEAAVIISRAMNLIK